MYNPRNMEWVPVRVKRLPHAVDLELPQARTPGSVGLDLVAAVSDPIRLRAGERALVPTGISIELPEGYEGQVRPRSGIAWEKGLTLLNSPGTIDSDYRGEIKVICINLGDRDVTISRGDRVAQLIVAPVVTVEWVDVGELETTARGAGGFGHTGL